MAAETVLMADLPSIDITDEGEFDEFDIEEVLGMPQADIVRAAKLSGNYAAAVKHMIDKHKSEGHFLAGSNMAAIDSYDCAEHIKTDEKRTNVLSFNSQMCCSSSVSAGASTSQSFNILTWGQLLEEGKFQCFEPFSPIYKEKAALHFEKLFKDEERCNVLFYDYHDGKMLYLLTQHSLWNWHHHPFLLCKCSRGAAVDTNHKCKIISQEEQVRLYSHLKHWWD